MLCRDLRQLNGEVLLEAAQRGVTRLQPGATWDGSVDAVVGGPPCQGFSTGGKREVGDVRNQMILEFVRIVEEVKPRVLCLENVAGLLDARFAAVREETFCRLRAAGYVLSGTDQTLNAKDFGIPQSRRRLIVLGWRDGDPGIPLAEGFCEVTVREALEGLPDPANYPLLLLSDQTKLEARDVLMRASTRSVYARTLAGLEVASWDYSFPRIWDENSITGSRRTAHSRETVHRFAHTLPGSVESRSRLFRLPPQGQARTLRAGTGTERGAHTSPRPIHPAMDRVITVREAARLHSYPDWFRFHVTNWHGHRQIGNSVPPGLARSAGGQLMTALGLSPLRPRTEMGLGSVSLLSLSKSEATTLLGALEDELPAARSRRQGKTPMSKAMIGGL